jgi:hypothetical protein
MINLRILIFAFLQISISMGNAQNLSSHHWNDRLVIILVKDQSNQILKNQISELKKSVDGLEDRRIVVYQSLPGKYQKGLGNGNKWEASGEIYKRLKESDSEFEIVLIGLDGGIKLRKRELLKCEELFGVIDQMPMRRSEMNRKKRP